MENMENDDMMPKALGCYETIRSSPDKNAMIGWGWHKPEYDETSQRWFETTGCCYNCWWDSKASLEADERDKELFYREHPECAVRESFCDITYGEENETPEHMLIICEEIENGKCHGFSFTIDGCSEEEAEELEKKLKTWHASGVLRIDSPKCVSFETFSYTLDLSEPEDWQDDGESIDDMEELPYD